MTRENIFAELYNKVLSFFVTPQVMDPTKEKAMSRLKVVLMQDRVGFSERALQMMKSEMVSCISRYMEIKEEQFELQLEAQDENTVLMLTIPVVRPKSDEEIDTAIKEQEAKTQVKAEEIVQELEEIIEERAQALADELLESKQVEDDGSEDVEQMQIELEQDIEVDEVQEEAECDSSDKEAVQEVAAKGKKK